MAVLLVHSGSTARHYSFGMCGRDSQFYTWREVHAFSGGLPLVTPDADPVPNYNRAPTQEGWAIVAADQDGGAALPMRWGLLPAWAKDTRLAYKTINARLETVAEKPAFRSAWVRRRCLIPSSGYYEWIQLDPKTKQPYFIHLADAPVMFYAGLWDARTGADGGELLTYSVITRDADQTVATIHDRMPLILPTDVFPAWLHGTSDDAMSIALSVPSANLVYHPVSRAVGNVRNTGPQLVEPLVGSSH
ncbi:SOS response-associated peptidase [Novilysobacter antarcticus]|uniref:SOS response-associated peptidase n=1 Tax=Novilysobacter antarcticus TaxID=2862543 RepID=UPI001C99EF1A|nr:SOS response-associated peptidase [Lysobacter antarcticus]